MHIIQTLLTATALAMDALSVSLGVGACLNCATSGKALRMGGAFGGFQFLMPLLGWILGKRFLTFISAYDHWVAFGLLLLIGFNMIRESMKTEENECYRSDPTKGWILLSLAVATSIDALAVGIGFVAIDGPVIALSISTGLITALLSFCGVLVGCRIGTMIGRRAETLGGIVLCLIAFNILKAHLLY